MLKEYAVALVLSTATPVAADSNTGGKAAGTEQQAEGTRKPSQMGDTGGTEPNRLPDEEWQTESELGGTTDGAGCWPDATANRVDRLRLLGNGVVPATAAKAWTVLSGRFE